VIEIKMPRLSDTMEEGAISTWRKQPGDTVAVGDVLVEIETDKAVMEYEAYEAGTLAQILVPEGKNADIGTPIALLDDGAGGLALSVSAASAPPPSPAAAQAAPTAPAVPASVAASSPAAAPAAPAPAAPAPAPAAPAPAAPTPARALQSGRDLHGAGAVGDHVPRAAPQHRIRQGLYGVGVGHRAERPHAEQPRRLLALGPPGRVLARHQRVGDAGVDDERHRSRR
jgi:pyruvate dehydrogenase E2 component (dihydrolipoamide acetyltransferase)